MLKHSDAIDKIFVGVVESNVDPYRLGRIKVRVQTIYDTIPLEDIPYATPFKSTDGKSFNVPAVGKVVSVVFDNGNIYMPVYHYAENYNKNLQNKLDSLSDDDYPDFVAFSFDHKIQNYIDSKGYRLDYYYNQLHIDEESVNIRLKDNTSMLNLGSSDSNQEAVLGTNFFKWFDKFMNKLLIPTSMIDSMGSAIVKPEIDFLIQEYITLRPTMASMHVKLPENNSIEKVKRDVETVVKTNDPELLVNKQSPFDVGKTNTQNSDILSEDVKKNIEDKNDKEQSKLNKAQPTDLVFTEERDYHMDYTDPDPNAKLYKKSDSGEIVETSYNDILLNDNDFKSDVLDDTTVDNVTDTYGDEDNVVNDDNYGSYAIGSDSDATSVSDYNKPKIIVPPSVSKTDSNGNKVADTVPIYKSGKLTGNEPYIMLQGKKIVKSYYEPLMQMIESAKKDGVSLRLNEAYREIDEQLFLRRKNEKEDFTENELMVNASSNYKPLTAKPGSSIHHRGAAFDFQTAQGRNKAYAWLVKNAIKFGFVRTVKSETWHWEYQPWTYTGKSKGQYTFVSKTDSSWMGISTNN